MSCPPSIPTYPPMPQKKIVNIPSLPPPDNGRMTTSQLQSKGLTSNKCDNPTNDSKGIWCYTGNNLNSKEYCGMYNRIAKTKNDRYYPSQQKFNFNMSENMTTGFSKYDSSSRNAGYILVNEIVYLTGMIKNEFILEENTIIDVLPISCRPDSNRTFNVLVGDKSGRLDIGIDGSISIVTSDKTSLDKGYLSLDGISFPISFDLSINVDYGKINIKKIGETIFLGGSINYSPGMQINIVGQISEEYRPSNKLLFLCNQNRKSVVISVNPDGNIICESPNTTGGFISLDGIVYNKNK